MIKTRVSVGNSISLKESAYDKSSGKLTLTVIRPGFNTSKSRFYKESALKKGHKIFEGAKMFVNHATSAEERARPEGDVNQWAASLKRTWVEADGTIKGEAIVVDPAFKAKLDNLSEANLLGEMGVSIRAIGEAYTEKIEGVETSVVENFIAARSVDFVTYPGAGGRVEAIESDRHDANDVDLITLEQLRERRPDLVQLVEAKLNGGTMDKTVAQLNQELTEAQAKGTKDTAEIARLTAELTKVTERVTAAESVQKKATATIELNKLLKESKPQLPEKAQERIRSRFKEAEDTKGMAEAIKEEAEYIAALSGKGGVRNLGESHQGEATPSKEEAEKSLIASFQKLGMSEAEAKIAAAGQ
jgi:uncharacterized coiled-coil protein SlyX